VGIYPHGIAITPTGQGATPSGTTAYVASTGPDTGLGGSQIVSVIDAGTYAVTANVEVGDAPRILALSPDSSLVAVTCADGVYVIETADNSVYRAEVELHNPNGVTFSPVGSEIWIADSERNQVVVVSTATLAAIAQIPVGQTPWNIAFSADGTTAYVTNTNEDTVSIVDVSNSQQTGKVQLPSFTAPNLVVTTSTYTQRHHQPTAIARSPADGTIWVACNSSSSLAVIDPATNTVADSLEIGLGDSPTAIAFATIS
jgi:phospholipase C